MDVSRSGRIRKKSSKLADFESPDDIESSKTPKSSSKPRTPAAPAVKEYPLIVDDPDSPEDLDDLHEAEEIREDEFESIPDVQGLYIIYFEFSRNVLAIELNSIF